MQTPDIESIIDALHDAYTSITGLEVKKCIHIRAYADYLAHGFTLDDWRCVLLYLRLQNRRMNGAAYSLRLNSLLDFEYHKFDSFLAEARAVHRNRVVPSAREKVLNSWRGMPPETATANTAVQAKSVVKDALAKLAKEL